MQGCSRNMGTLGGIHIKRELERTLGPEKRNFTSLMPVGLLGAASGEKRSCAFAPSPRAILNSK